MSFFIFITKNTNADRILFFIVHKPFLFAISVLLILQTSVNKYNKN